MPGKGSGSPRLRLTATADKQITPPFKQSNVEYKMKYVDDERCVCWQLYGADSSHTIDDV